MFKLQLARQGQTMEEGAIVDWLKKEGETFATGDDLYDVETEKAVVTVEATRPGRLVRILVQPGETVPVGTPLAVMAEPGEEPSSQEIAALAATGAGSDAEEAGRAELPAAGQAVQPGRKVEAMPKARALAQEMGIMLDTLTGTGPDGVITADDVRRAGGASSNVAASADGEVLRTVKLTGVHKAMADSVERSWKVPQFTQIVLVDATNLRRRKEASAGAFSYMDLLLEGAVAAAREVPEVLAAYRDGEVTYYRHANIGIAAMTSQGLVLPVLRHADTMEMSARRAAWKSLVERARDGALGPDDMRGATIALSNLGSRGVDTGTPLLPNDVSAVIFFGELATRALVIEDRVEARPSLYVSVAYDHRTVDGALGARFTGALKTALEAAGG